MSLPDGALEQITVEGYKSIRQLSELRLTELNVLIGANGAGKTNFISLFRMFRAMLDRRLQVYIAANGGAQSILYQGPKITHKLHIKLDFGENLYECTLEPDAQGGLFFSSEIAYVYDRKKYTRPYNRDLGAGHKETHLFEDAGGYVAKYSRQKMATWTLYHFHDTGPRAAAKQLCDINDNASLHGDAGNLAPFLMLLKSKHSASYRQIVDAVKLAAPFFGDFALRPNPYDPSKTLLEWREQDSESLFGPNDLSDGTLRFIMLATALLQPNPPTTIVIDEPELGLHPFAISLLAGLMKTTSSRTQVIVSTQSVPLVNQFTPDNIIVVDRVDKQSTFQRLDAERIATWLEDYGLGDLWEKNVLGGRPSYA